eukprot:3581797-Amphidinium_carterae.1
MLHITRAEQAHNLPTNWGNASQNTENCARFAGKNVIWGVVLPWGDHGSGIQHAVESERKAGLAKVWE